MVAGLLRTGLIPEAYVYLAEREPARDTLRCP
jgi:hypothetical protein